MASVFQETAVLHVSDDDKNILNFYVKSVLLFSALVLDSRFNSNLFFLRTYKSHKQKSWKKKSRASAALFFYFFLLSAAKVNSIDLLLRVTGMNPLSAQGAHTQLLY